VIRKRLPANLPAAIPLSSLRGLQRIMNSAPPHALPEASAAERYNRIRRWLAVSDFLVGLGLLIVLLATGWTGRLRDLALQASFHIYTLGVFFYVFLLMLIGKLMGAGLDYCSFRLEESFRLSNQKLRGWIWDQCKEFLVTFLLAAPAAGLLYFIIREFPEHWWLLSWAIFLGLTVLLAQLAPVLLFPIFYKFEPLQDEGLKARLVSLGEHSGTRVRGVYQWNLSEKSNKANAALMGLGRTRRIVLADTLLDNYSADEIEAVLAHELGHHVHRHILKSIVVQAVVTVLGFAGANWVLHYAVDRAHIFETLSDFANLPLLILVAAFLSLLASPALNAYSRFNERQADRYAFASIASVEPFISSMNKLARQNLAERTPARLVGWLFHSHPAISVRIAAAEAWAARPPASGS
jgi:STE24 endopeptidase